MQQQWKMLKVKGILTVGDSCVRLDLCMHERTVSVYTPLDKQSWQCAGLTISGVDMTVSEMTENNCKNTCGLERELQAEKGREKMERRSET